MLQAGNLLRLAFVTSLRMLASWCAICCTRLVCRMHSAARICRRRFVHMPKAPFVVVHWRVPVSVDLGAAATRYNVCHG